MTHADAGPAGNECDVSWTQQPIKHCLPIHKCVLGAQVIEEMLWKRLQESRPIHFSQRTSMQSSLQYILSLLVLHCMLHNIVLQIIQLRLAMQLRMDFQQ